MIFSFLVIFDCVHNFQVFLPIEYGKKMSQKLCNVLKWIFEFLSFFLYVFDLRSIYFTFAMHLGLRRIQNLFYIRGLCPPKPPFLWEAPDAF